MCDDSATSILHIYRALSAADNGSVITKCSLKCTANKGTLGSEVDYPYKQRSYFLYPYIMKTC